MNKPTLQDVLSALCAQDNRVPKRKTGEAHHTKAADAIGVNQATLSRMLAGQSQHPSPENAEKICAFFSITYDQLVGNTPIPWLDQGNPFAKYDKPETASTAGGVGESFVHAREILISVSNIPSASRLAVIEQIARQLTPRDKLKLATRLIEEAQDSLE